MATAVSEDVFKNEQAPKKEVKAPKVEQRLGSALGSAERKEQLTGVFQLAAGVLTVVNPPDACAVLVHSGPIVQEIDNLAERDPRVAAILEKVLQAGPYGALLAAVAPLALQIATNHGLLKPGILGTVDKEQLVAMVIGPQTEGEGGHNGPSPDVQQD